MNSAINEALKKKEQRNKLLPLFKELGISIMSNLERSANLLKRAMANPNLGEALKEAKKSGLAIYSENEFRISANHIDININASDQEIIGFILGK